MSKSTSSLAYGRSRKREYCTPLKLDSLLGGSATSLRGNDRLVVSWPCCPLLRRRRFYQEGIKRGNVSEAIRTTRGSAAPRTRPVKIRFRRFQFFRGCLSGAAAR